VAALAILRRGIESAALDAAVATGWNYLEWIRPAATAEVLQGAAIVSLTVSRKLKKYVNNEYEYHLYWT